MLNKTLEKWEEKTLEQLGDILDSQRKPITKRDRIAGEYPYYGATGLQDMVAGYIFDEPLVLIGEDGAKWGAGDKTAYSISGKCWVNNHAHVFRPNRTYLLDNYLINYLNYIDLKPFITGATVEKLNQEKLRSIPIPVPPLSEQQRIVEILDEAFENIEKAKQNALQNLNNAKELFESYLIDTFLNNNETWLADTLQNICEKISAGGDRPEIFSETKTLECNIPIYSNGIKDNGLYGYTNNPTIEKPAITISARGTIGFICKRLEPYCPIVRLISLIPKDFIDLSFLAYAMNFIIPKNTGTSIPQLTVPNLKTSKIQYPSLSEQQRIVGILDDAFENIEKVKQNALQNLNNAKELFESCLDELFTKNTDNWNKYKVKDLCEYAKEQGHYNLPYVGMEHIKSSGAEFIGTLDNTEVKSTTFHFDKGIILYGRLRPYLRKVILTTFEGHCSTELFPIKVNDKVNNKFLMYWLLSQRITDKINATWTGARMPRANMNKVLEFDISIPSIMEQQKIVQQLDELQEQTKKLEQIYEQRIKDLDELKQSILQKAFNGEL